jgi:hypothetical protein
MIIFLASDLTVTGGLLVETINIDSSKFIATFWNVNQMDVFMPSMARGCREKVGQ